MNVHPDLEALSASLDGEDEEARAHVEGCSECAGRVASLRAVREAVGRPVTPLSSERREESLAAALAAFGGEARAAEPAPVVELGSRRWQWVAGSAVAAVLVLIVGMAALFGGGGGGRDESTTAGQALRAPAADSAKSNAESAGAGAGAGAAGDAAVRDGGNLGELANVEALRSRYAARLTPSGAAGAQASSSPAGTGLANSSASPSVPAPVAVGTRACELQARAARPSVGVVVYAATATFQGTPAVVLGFGPTAGSPPTVLLVLAPDQGCRLLGETAPS